MFNPLKDGITHINAYSKGRTAFGRFLSNWDSSLRIELPEVGWVRSLEGYWFYLKTNNDVFLYLEGYQAKGLASKLNVDGNLNAEQQIKFKEAVWAKILGNCKNVIKWAKEYKDLPIVHYYVFGGKVVPAGPDWWTQYLNRAVKQIVDFVEPILVELDKRGWYTWYSETYMINPDKGFNEYKGMHPIFAAIQEQIATNKDFMNPKWYK